jgi:outer membrane protein assembly factor BamA
LGGKTLLSDITPVKYDQLRIYEVALRKVDKNFSLGAGYNLDYHWNIEEFKTAPTDVTDMDKYGFKTKSTSSGITVNAQFDNRLNSNNPSNGTYANLQIRDNLQVLGSNSDWKSAILDIRHYFKLTEEAGNVLALWSYDWLTLNGKPPYFDLPMIGGDPYNNTGRGYVEGRFRGMNFLYFEAEYRFRIMNNGFLGGVLFSNVSAFSDQYNKFNYIDPANGIGLRIKMNKKSNVNLSIDYGIGIDGSRGFVFNMSEVF